MDSMGPIQNENLGGKRYIFVIVNDFSEIHLGRISKGNIMHLKDLPTHQRLAIENFQDGIKIVELWVTMVKNLRMLFF